MTLTHKHLKLPQVKIVFCHHCSKKWPGARSAPCHFLNQCWLIMDKSIMNRFQSNILRDSHIFHDKHATLCDIFFGMPNFCRCLRVNRTRYSFWIFIQAKYEIINEDLTRVNVWNKYVVPLFIMVTIWALFVCEMPFGLWDILSFFPLILKVLFKYILICMKRCWMLFIRWFYKY